MREFHSTDLLSRPLKPIDYLVDGVFPLGTLGDVSGPPGDGKSTILLSLADHISSGRQWFGRRVRLMPVAWISGEASGEDAIQRDLARIKAGQDSDILFLQPNDEPMFRFDKQFGRWITTSEGAAILQRCRDAGVGFVVFDTIGSLCSGLVEIDNDQQRQLARHLKKEMGCMSGITVSHTNQASARDELAWRLHYLSRAGGNGFPGAVRWAAGVSQLQEDDAERLGGRITREEIRGSRLSAFGVSKHNEMPRPGCNNGSPMVFEIKPDGELVLLVDGEVLARHQRANPPRTRGRGGKGKKAGKDEAQQAGGGEDNDW